MGSDALLRRVHVEWRRRDLRGAAAIGMPGAARARKCPSSAWAARRGAAAPRRPRPILTTNSPPPPPPKGASARLLRVAAAAFVTASDKPSTTLTRPFTPHSSKVRAAGQGGAGRGGGRCWSPPQHLPWESPPRGGPFREQRPRRPRQPPGRVSKCSGKVLCRRCSFVGALWPPEGLPERCCPEFLPSRQVHA